jgi:hypothetical protein
VFGHCDLNEPDLSLLVEGERNWKLQFCGDLDCLSHNDGNGKHRRFVYALWRGLGASRCMFNSRLPNM